MSFLKNLFGGKSPAPSQTPVAQAALVQTRTGVRERYFYKEYYDKVLADSTAFDQETKKQYDQLIAERGPEYNGYKIIEFQLSDGLLIQLTTAYSRGDSVQSLIPLYEKAVYHFVKSWDSDDFIYNQVLRIISLGWLLNSQHSLTQLATLFSREKFGDKLINYLLHPEKPGDEPDQSLLFPDDEGLTLLWDITQSDKELAAKKMKVYLENYWYTPDNLDTNYNSHLTNKGSHFGYWAFEAGAISKIMKLDDGSYQKNEFYPYDLVHWQEYHEPSR
ncbi:PoNe immunity protein domain-containing protein [uncultured Fibrella sp.]|uniref:PoNe immunity protein domain-containing protein n=1 Tax=uncultured Fibrella sp. TaxID=1284596 RepID=UPI0035CAB772